MWSWWWMSARWQTRGGPATCRGAPSRAGGADLSRLPPLTSTSASCHDLRTTRNASRMTDEELIEAARALTGRFTPSEDCCAGKVAAALETTSGHIFTGICIDTACSLGFCAEHSAVAEMLKARESEIHRIVAVNVEGHVLAPCGRCRELLLQVNPSNRQTRVIVAPGEVASLEELLPRRWHSAYRGSDSG